VSRIINLRSVFTANFDDDLGAPPIEGCCDIWYL
jgi:hypothetical protein